MTTLASVAVSEATFKDVTAPDAPLAPEQGTSAGRLQDLIPIVMVIVGGCEPCAEKMVARALQLGSSWQDIDKTLRIIADMQRRECFAKAVGTDVITRMEKPLAAGWRTLQHAITSVGK